jgi:ATP-dependent exoDNAse (exonuclease V) alpha subunit
MAALSLMTRRVFSGVSVYKEAERAFAEGDRIQFRAPFTDKRIVNGELGSITRLEPGQMRVRLDSGSDVAIDPQQFRHIDYGYAVTSHSSQGLTVDRVLVNADTRESLQLLNDRMAYVAVSRAREEALIYTDSASNLRETLNRGTDKEMALKSPERQVARRAAGSRSRDSGSTSTTEPKNRARYGPWHNTDRSNTGKGRVSKQSSAQPYCFRTTLST